MVVVLTPDEILRTGLILVGWDGYRQDRAQRETNLKRFRSAYGSDPIVYARIWEDLQTTDVSKARINAEAAKNFNYFLMALHFLKCYNTETQQSGTFGYCENTVREWNWFFVRKIAKLKKQKVSSF